MATGLPVPTVIVSAATPSLLINMSGRAVSKYGIISNISRVVDLTRIAFPAPPWGIDKPKGNAILGASSTLYIPASWQPPFVTNQKGIALSPRAL
jgi:hypothetical protein